MPGSHASVSQFPPRSRIFTSNQGERILEYLKGLGAKTIIEEQYVDRDYLIDYQLFYSRSFEQKDRFTRRLHFFSRRFDANQFKKILNSGGNDKNYGYLGFVIIKPVKDSDEKLLVGRTILQPPSAKRTHFVGKTYEVSLFGISLEVFGLPFQVQDRSVSACATIALWTVTQPLSELFQTPIYSPGEITQKSTAFPSEARIFPSAGLNIFQMITFLRSIGLDVEVIGQLTGDIVASAVRAYVDANIPLIATLKLRKGKREDYHAVVIGGYGLNSRGRVDRLFVHDDQMAPYTLVKPTDLQGFVVWDAPWTKLGYVVELEKLLVPVYQKIRLDFHGAYPTYQRTLKNIEKLGLSKEYRLDFFLTTVQEYKKFLLSKNIENKDEVLTALMPRFLWIIRALVGNAPMGDAVYDGTTPFPVQVRVVEYKAP